MKGRALVTGSAGFAGRHYVQALKESGFDVTEVDVAGRYPVDALDFFQNWTGVTFDLVIHCAAVVGGRAKIDGRPLELAVNLELDASLFRWALRSRPGRILYISSSAAYPAERQTLSRHERMQEDFIDFRQGRVGMPDELYGWAKLTGEMLAHRARQAGLAVTVVRPFSGYGADQDPDYPFRAFAERAKRHEDPFVIWGSGQQVRDFIHIDDVVDGSLLLALQGMNGPVNLGTGRPVSMRELAGKMCAAAGYDPEFEVQRDAPMGVSYRVADVSRMVRQFEPSISLEEGIDRAMAG